MNTIARLVLALVAATLLLGATVMLHHAYAQPADCRDVPHSNAVIRVCIAPLEPQHTDRAAQALQHLPVPADHAVLGPWLYWASRVNAARDRGVALGVFVNGKEPSGVLLAMPTVIGGPPDQWTLVVNEVLFDPERNAALLLEAGKAAAKAKGAALGRTRVVTVFEPL